MGFGRYFGKTFKLITSLYSLSVTDMPKPKQKRQKVLNKIDQKVMGLLQKEEKALTLQEIASKTGEAPKKKS
jgi:hypothetical protein